MKKSARNNSDNSGLSAGRKQKTSSHGAQEVPMDVSWNDLWQSTVLMGK